jgi:cyclopropane fatty-acyl-phospholipid synthase-like methyltransferase
LLAGYRHKGLSTLLDVGCGVGEYADVFAKLGFDFTGVDVSPDMVAQANRAGHRAVLLDELKEKPEQYDIVFISHVIEHLDTENLIRFLDFYIGRVKSEGILILLSPLAVDNFYYDITHVRPYYPQAIWQMWGDYKSSLSIRKNEQLRLIDIHFIRDCYRTRKWRSYYVAENKLRWHLTRCINYTAALLFLLSKARIGRKTSWLGVYKKH